MSIAKTFVIIKDLRNRVYICGVVGYSRKSLVYWEVSMITAKVQLSVGKILAKIAVRFLVVLLACFVVYLLGIGILVGLRYTGAPAALFELFFKFMVIFLIITPAALGFAWLHSVVELVWGQYKLRRQK